MRIVSHPKPKLRVPKMECDTVIDNKLLKYPAISDCFSNTFFLIINGKPGQGKTSTTIGLLRGVFRRCFADMFVIIPSISLTSIPDEDNIFSLLPDENLYNEYNEKTMEDIYKRAQENSETDNYSLLVIDDYGSSFANEGSPENKLLRKMIIKMRHLRCSIILLTQNVYQLPRKTRELASSILFFDAGKSQNNKIIADFLPFNNKQCEDIMSAFTNPHDHITLNTKSHRVYRNLADELVFEDEEK
jgi:hypothetical protein